MIRFEYYSFGTKHEAKLPQSLSELTIRELTDLARYERLDADRLEYVSILSGVGLPYLEAFDEDSKQLLRNCIEYLWYDVIMVQDIHGLEFLPIGKLQLNQFEHWRRDPSLVNTVALLHSGEYSYSDRMERIDEYYSLPADIALYCREFYTKEFAQHQKKFSYLYEQYEPTADEVMAGYDELSKWGVYGTYEMLAGGDIFKMEQASKLPVDDAYYYMMYQKTKNEYQKKLTDVVLRNTRNR